MIFAGLSFSVLASLVLPLGLIIYTGVKKRPLFPSIFLGALCFFVFQLISRIPLLQFVLPQMNWYQLMATTKPVLYILFLSLTAALFEEIGRYIIMGFFMKRQRTIDDALAFGLGHGAIESILLVGLPTLTVLLSQNSEFYSQLSFSFAAAGGIERILTIVIHMGLSMLVMQSLRRKNLLWLLLALFMHTSVNFFSVYALNIMGLNIWLVELIVALFSVSLAYYACFEYKRAKAEA
jgi:uncharacterized membrane protein YhfC